MNKKYFILYIAIVIYLLASCVVTSQPILEKQANTSADEEEVSIDVDPQFESMSEITEERKRLRDRISSGLNYQWFFGNWDEIEKSEEYLDIAKDSGLILLHLTNNDISPEQVISLRKGHDGISGTEDDVIVIGYLSIGEDIRTDNDHMQPLEIGDSRGPVYWDYENGEKVYQNNGYPSYYLDDREKDGEPDRNWQYGGCYADPGNPDYQRMLKNGEKERDGFVGLDELYSLYQCDGVFLDTMDVVNPLGWGFPFYFEWVASGGQQLIEQFRDWYPDKLILLNRTLVYFDPNQKQGDGTPYLGTWGKDVEDDIDLLFFEGFYWPGDEVRNRNYWAPKINAEADRPGGFTVMVLDYVGDASITVDGDFEDWIANGEVQEGVEKLDEALIWSKGIYTPNEDKDCETPGIDIVDIWMANEPENINMYMRMDFAGQVDLDLYNYYIFLDTDQSRESGYWNTANCLLGSDYMITDYDEDHFVLYRYTNDERNDVWEWESVCPIPYAIGVPFGERSAFEFEIPKEQLGEENKFDEAVDLVVFSEDSSKYPYIIDLAPDTQCTDFYQYLSRTKSLGFQETVTRQGWLAYNKPLIGGSKVPLLNLDAAPFMDAADDVAPVWDSTAASPGVAIPASPVPRVGIQEAEPGDGSITVRWDTARDKSRPVTYTIYYSTESPVDPETAMRIERVDNTSAGRNYYKGSGKRVDFPNGIESPHGFYSQKVGEGVYPYEYTITGLKNDTTYYCMVRASDNAEHPNTETNSVEIAATPRKRSSSHKIFVDGNNEDWEQVIALDYSPGETADPDTLPKDIDLTEIRVTEDQEHLYFLITIEGSAAFGQKIDQLSILIDSDTDKSTGYSGPYVPVFPWEFGADHMIQNGSLYTHQLMDGYRIWNWNLESENGDGISRMAYTASDVEISIKKSALGDPQTIHVAIETDRLLDDGTHLIDRAPNDLFSHYYTYEIQL